MLHTVVLQYSKGINIYIYIYIMWLYSIILYNCPRLSKTDKLYDACNETWWNIFMRWRHCLWWGLAPASSSFSLSHSAPTFIVTTHHAPQPPTTPHHHCPCHHHSPWPGPCAAAWGCSCTGTGVPLGPVSFHNTLSHSPLLQPPTHFPVPVQHLPPSLTHSTNTHA